MLSRGKVPSRLKTQKPPTIVRGDDEESLNDDDDKQQQAAVNDKQQQAAVNDSDADLVAPPFEVSKIARVSWTAIDQQIRRDALVPIQRLPHVAHLPVAGLRREIVETFSLPLLDSYLNVNIIDYISMKITTLEEFGAFHFQPSPALTTHDKGVIERATVQELDKGDGVQFAPFRAMIKTRKSSSDSYRMKFIQPHPDNRYVTKLYRVCQREQVLDATRTTDEIKDPENLAVAHWEGTLATLAEQQERKKAPYFGFDLPFKLTAANATGRSLSLTTLPNTARPYLRCEKVNDKYGKQMLPGFNIAQIDFNARHSFSEWRRNPLGTIKLYQIKLGDPQIFIVVPGEHANTLCSAICRCFPGDSRTCLGIEQHEQTMLTVSYLRKKKIPYALVSYKINF